MTLKDNSFFIYAAIVCICLNFCACHHKAEGANPIITENSKSINDTIRGLKIELVSDQVKEPVDLQTRANDSNRLYITDLRGKIFILEHNKLLPDPFLDISRMTIAIKQKSTPNSTNENILFGMAFHPDFAKNHKFYICYRAPDDDQGLRKMVVSEFQTFSNNHNIADPASERVVLQIHDKKLNDGTIAFGPDRFLYLNFADLDTLGGKEYAQDMTSLVGKVLRIDINKQPYGIPPDNPYALEKNEKPEIWAAGFRKLWRFSFDPKSHIMLGADVGDKKLEEVDIIKKGGNYGWPITEGDSLHPGNYKTLASAFTAPINTYARNTGICTIGGYVYEGKELPALKDKYVFGDMNGSLYALTQSSSGKWIRQVIQLKNKPVDPLLIFSFGQDDKGEIYIIGRLSDKLGMKGEIYKLVKS